MRAWPMRLRSCCHAASGAVRIEAEVIRAAPGVSVPSRSAARASPCVAGLLRMPPGLASGVSTSTSLMLGIAPLKDRDVGASASAPARPAPLPRRNEPAFIEWH